MFDLVPSEGRIAPGATQEVTVTFAPDHPNDHYSDHVKIELFGKVSFKILVTIFLNHFKKCSRNNIPLWPSFQIDIQCLST